MQFAWARPGQDLGAYFDRSHKAGCIVTYMAGNVPEAKRAAQAGADIVIAQGTEGGVHVGWMASLPLIPDGRRCRCAGSRARDRRICRRSAALCCSLALGADGILLGTRFLATVRSPLHQNFKQAIVGNDSHDTQPYQEIPDIAAGLVWPGAMTRSRRNRFIERWAGREWALRRDQAEAREKLNAARRSGDVEEGPLSMGQDAGIDSRYPVRRQIVTRIAQEAETLLDEICRA